MNLVSLHLFCIAGYGKIAAHFLAAVPQIAIRKKICAHGILTVWYSVQSWDNKNKKKHRRRQGRRCYNVLQDNV